jgi:Transglycosylase-like domain
VPRIVRLERRVADVKDESFRARRVRDRLEGASIGELRVQLRRTRRELHRAKAALAAPAPTATAYPNLEAIAACESGGNAATNTCNGFYGKYQFSAETWAAVGGTGNPAAASEAEQDRRAAMLYAQQGSSAWPVCGR